MNFHIHALSQLVIAGVQVGNIGDSRVLLGRADGTIVEGRLGAQVC